MKAAVAFKRAGDPRHAEAADAAWGRLEKAFPRAGLAIGRKTYSLDDLRVEFARPVELMFGTLGYDVVAMRYGNPSHTGAVAGGTPFLDPAFAPFPMLWRKPDPDDKTDFAAEARAAAAWVKEQIEQGYRMLKPDKGQVALPGFFPVTAQDLILFRTYDGVCAVVTREGFAQGGQAYRAGEMLWASSVGNKGGAQCLAAEKNQQTAKMWWQQWQQQHGMATLIFDNPQVGSLSHDGKMAYYVDDLAIPPPPQVYNPNFGGMPAQPGVAGDLRGAIDASKLMALDMANGALRWELGGPSSDAPKVEGNDPTGGAARLLQDAIFLGPPLPVNGVLYVLFEKEQQLQLACLNPHKAVAPPGGAGPQLVPDLLWVQKIGSPNVRLSQDSLRRIQPSYLAYADGVLVCPTNCGAVVAVDVNARSLLWARGYSTPPSADGSAGQFKGGGRFVGGGRVVINGRVQGQQPLSSDRWRAAAPIVAGGKVLVAAHDANQIQCLDLRTGDLLWADDRKADDLYVGGVSGGKAMVVGKEFVRAYDLAGGEAGKPKLAWQGLKVATPCGHGAVTRDGLYYLPMVGDPDHKDSRDPQVWAIDFATGAAKSKTAFRRDDLGVDQQFGPDDLRRKLALGNLVFHDRDDVLAVRVPGVRVPAHRAEEAGDGPAPRQEPEGPGRPRQPRRVAPRRRQDSGGDRGLQGGRPQRPVGGRPPQGPPEAVPGVHRTAAERLPRRRGRPARVRGAVRGVARRRGPDRAAAAVGRAGPPQGAVPVAGGEGPRGPGPAHRGVRVLPGLRRPRRQPPTRADARRGERHVPAGRVGPGPDRRHDPQRDGPGRAESRSRTRWRRTGRPSAGPTTSAGSASSSRCSARTSPRAGRPRSCSPSGCFKRTTTPTPATPRRN